MSTYIQEVYDTKRLNNKLTVKRAKASSVIADFSYPIISQKNISTNNIDSKVVAIKVHPPGNIGAFDE